MYILSLSPLFPSPGLVIIARNYLEVYPYDKWSDSIVPDFAEGETFIPSVCEMREGQTSRPNLLTEADLVGLMDKNGIGESVVPFLQIQACSTAVAYLQALMLPSRNILPKSLRENTW
jgi:DNA topoisomerase-3